MTAELVTLLHLCDSLFPLGSFAHSDGLEAATSAGDITDAAELRDWMDTVLHVTLRRSEGLAVAVAWQRARQGDLEGLACLDAELSALRPSSTGRDASRAMGVRLLKTWSALRPSPVLQASAGHCGALSLPCAFALVCAASGVDQPDAVSGFLYTRLAATISAAMRLMPLGQQEAHGLLTGCLAQVPAVTAAILVDDAPIGAFTPALDVAAMRQQYGHSRLFRS